MNGPPQISDEPRGAARGFIAVSLAVAVGLIGLVGAVNAVVDPYATLGTDLVQPTVWTDRGEKVELYDALPEPPRVVILGSSRAMKLEPRYLTRDSDLPAFNFAVSDGKAPDAYAIACLAHDRAPDVPQRFLWLFDLETFSDRPIDPRLLATDELARYLPATARMRGRAEDLAWLLSWDTLRESLRAMDREIEQRDATAEGALEERTAPTPEFAADGFRRWDAHDRRAERGRTRAELMPGSIRLYSDTYRNDFDGLSELSLVYVERTLAAMNDWDSRPVIVLSPIHPALRRALRPLGYEQRRREALSYFASLRDRFDFVLLDMTRLDAFGGSPDHFYDGVHMTTANTRRLIDAVVAGSEGVLAPRGDAQ